MEPYTQTSVLNEELKNPHLVETCIRVAPSTGKRIEYAEIDNLDKLKTVLNNKLKGNIPEYEVNFNIQGIPLLLTNQSYLEIRLTPHFKQQLRVKQRYLKAPFSFEYNRMLWPKVNAACITSAAATFSNFATENQYPTLLPYIRYFQLPTDIRDNAARCWNPSYLQLTDGGEILYANRYLNVTGNGTFQQPVHRSPYEVSALKLSRPDNVYSWYGQAPLIQIPLSDILPVFQVPVIPLRQTNTSNINLRLRLRSPRHMFFSAGYLNPSNAASFIKEAEAFLADADDIIVYSDEQVRLQERGGQGVFKPLQRAVVGGGTVAWLKAVTLQPFVQFEDMASFYMDFDVDCELVLKALTTPLLNPLVQSYIQPFIDEQNQFIAHFTDYFTYSQTLVCNLKANTRFSFTPSQLFYNTTHIVLFFVQDVVGNEAEVPLAPSLSPNTKCGNLKSLFAHGHFLLRENIEIKQFQILLGSSCTPLFDRPLDMDQMFEATEDAMKKYHPSEMYGDVMFIQNRFQEGNAFFFFDLTHARNSGYFIDADNMIRVEGVITGRQPLDQIIIPAAQNNNGAAGGIQPVQPGEARDLGEQEKLDGLSEEATIHIIMMLMYQNTFTVFLELDGAVLFQQQ